MKNFKKLMLFGGLSLMLLMNFIPAAALADTKSEIQCGVNQAAGASDCSAQPTTNLDDTVKTIINLLSIIVGIAAIIMIIVAGLRYITSAGEAEKVKSAKNGLLYALIGLVIVALSQTIVHFVLTEASNPSTASTTKKASP